MSDASKLVSTSRPSASGTPSRYRGFALAGKGLGRHCRRTRAQWTAFTPNRCSCEVLWQQVQQQTIVPAAVRGAFVATHDPHRSKPHALVGADRPLVVGRGIDRDAVVAAVLEQKAGQGPDRVGAQPSAMPGRVQEEVDGGVAVVGLVLLQ